MVNTLGHLIVSLILAARDFVLDHSIPVRFQPLYNDPVSPQRDPHMVNRCHLKEPDDDNMASNVDDQYT